MAAARIALAVTIIVNGQGYVSRYLLLASVIAFILAVVYEAARSNERGGHRDFWARFVILWVGGGYAVRVCLELQLGAAGATPTRDLAIAGIAAWAFGIAFISMTWALEGTKQLNGVPRKPYVDLLIRITRNLFRGDAPPPDTTTWRVLEGGGARQLFTPWSIAAAIGTIGFALFIGRTGTFAGRSVLPYLAIALASTILAAVLPSPARWRHCPASQQRLPWS